MTVHVPEMSLIVLIGASGSGKSTFASRHFLPTEVISSDWCRGAVSDDEASMDATNDAFALLHTMLDIRLRRGRLTVVDATNVQAHGRASLLKLAKEHDVPAVAVVFALPESVCHERNSGRPGRDFGPHVVRNHTRDLRQSLRGLNREGFRSVTVLRSPEEVDTVKIVRDKGWHDKTDDHGPFDIVGDVHGCLDELHELLGKLGYVVERLDEARPTTLTEPPGRHDGPWREITWSWRVAHPEGRKLVFVGDLVDRGPHSADALEFAMSVVAQGAGHCVPGNHDEKLLKHMKRRKVTLNHGLAETALQVESLPGTAQGSLRAFLESLVSHLVLDGGRLVVAHAGMKERYQGRASGRIREFALYGETTGESDEFGLPVRYPWALDYRGKAAVVYGHTPTLEAEWLNNTLCIDTGCAFGGKLTALRWPERETVSVPARATYAEPARPLGIATLSAQHDADDVLDMVDVLGRRYVETGLMSRVTIKAENSSAALEVVSRFGANPKWTVYLPPTMSPVQTSDRPGYLERPEEAFAYYREEGVERVVVQEKHMGSRAVVVLCRDPDVARSRFGVEGGESGAVLTRTGRRFLNDHGLEAALLARLALAMGASGRWEAWQTDWVVLDCELMPWSAKAQELLKSQYARVGAAGSASLEAALAAVTLAAEQVADPLVGDLAERIGSQRTALARYVEAYRRYCWPVDGLDGYRLAPFHVMATEGRAWTDRPHPEHMAELAALCAVDAELLLATPWREVDLADLAAVAWAVEWWESLVGAGG
jgi:protein phosphatase